MIVLTIILFLTLLFLLYFGYCTVTGKNVIPDFFKKKKKDDTTKGDINLPAPDNGAPGYCDFEGEDLYNGDVFTFDGKVVPVDVSPIECSTCNQYVYKNDDGCVNYRYDYLENSGVDDTKVFNDQLMCDPKHPERNKTCIQPHGICTPSLAPSQKCKF